MMKIFGKDIIGFECDTSKNAWQTFYIELENYLYWTKGYKYWRTLPELIEHSIFDTNKKTYLVRARLIISKKRFKTGIFKRAKLVKLV